jgi:hypothetical protein
MIQLVSNGLNGQKRGKQNPIKVLEHIAKKQELGIIPKSFAVIRVNVKYQLSGL